LENNYRNMIPNISLYGSQSKPQTADIKTYLGLPFCSPLWWQFQKS